MWKSDGLVTYSSFFENTRKKKRGQLVDTRILGKCDRKIIGKWNLEKANKSKYGNLTFKDIYNRKIVINLDNLFERDGTVSFYFYDDEVLQKNYDMKSNYTIEINIEPKKLDDHVFLDCSEHVIYYVDENVWYEAGREIVNAHRLMMRKLHE